jgi:hypothetical protein
MPAGAIDVAHHAHCGAALRVSLPLAPPVAKGFPLTQRSASLAAVSLCGTATAPRACLGVSQASAMGASGRMAGEARRRQMSKAACNQEACRCPTTAQAR